MDISNRLEAVDNIEIGLDAILRVECIAGKRINELKREVDALIREEVEALGSKDGGLMMIYGLYPGVPLENVAALMDAMERYATYYG